MKSNCSLFLKHLLKHCLPPLMPQITTKSNHQVGGKKNPLSSRVSFLKHFSDFQYVLQLSSSGNSFLARLFLTRLWPVITRPYTPFACSSGTIICFFEDFSNWMLNSSLSRKESGFIFFLAFLKRKKKKQTQDNNLNLKILQIYMFCKSNFMKTKKSMLSFDSKV